MLPGRKRGSTTSWDPCQGRVGLQTEDGWQNLHCVCGVHFRNIGPKIPEESGVAIHCAIHCLLLRPVDGSLDNDPY